MLPVTIMVGEMRLIIELAKSDQALIEAKAVDDLAFGGHQGISLEELREIRNQGAVILMRLHESRQPIGESQILFQPMKGLAGPFSESQGYCYGTGLLPDFQGRGLGKPLAYYQELLARENGIRELFMTIRVENYSSLRFRLGMNYKIYRYQPDFYGPDVSKHSRLFLKKNLSDNEIFPVGRVDTSCSIVVPVDFTNDYDAVAHSRISELLLDGYSGVAVDKRGIYFAK